MKMAKTGTETSDFGVSKRENHDSSKFYASNMYKGINFVEKKKVIDKSKTLDPSIFRKSYNITKFNEKLIEDCIHLAILILPQIKEEYLDEFDSYLNKYKILVKQLKEKLITGGRLIVIVDNNVKGENDTFYPLHTDISMICMELGYYMRGEIILNKELANENQKTKLPIKGRSIGKLTNAYYHGLIFSNEIPKRIRKDKKKDFEKTDTITRDQFLSYTKSVWSVEEELVTNRIQSCNIEKNDFISRFIHLYSFLEDIIVSIVPHADEVKYTEIIQSIREKSINFTIGT